MGFGRDVRSAIFRKVETFARSRSTVRPPSLITRNTNDVQQVQTVVFMALTLIISAPILIIGGIIMALRQDVPLSGLLVVVLPLMAAFIGLVMTPRGPALPGACRSSSTGSTRSCARPSPASASSGRSCGPGTRRRDSTRPTTTSSTQRSASTACSR